MGKGMEATNQMENQETHKGNEDFLSFHVDTLPLKANYESKSSFQ